MIQIDEEDGTNVKYFTSGGYVFVYEDSSCVINAVEVVPLDHLDQPLLHLDELAENQDAMSDFVKKNVFGAAHVCGTCRMGDAGDPLAVVDAEGRVHGVDGLMVADASVMPSVPSGNTHIPTIMLAEKIAAGIAG